MWSFFKSIMCYYITSYNFAQIVTYPNSMRLVFKQIEDFMLKIHSHNEVRIIIIVFIYAIYLSKSYDFSCRWRGSVYKLIWRELLAYLFFYYLINFTYRYVLNEHQRQWVYLQN